MQARLQRKCAVSAGLTRQPTPPTQLKRFVGFPADLAVRLHLYRSTPCSSSRCYQQNGGRRHIGRRRSTTCSYMNFDKKPDIEDRIIASLPFLLPLLDSFPYGRYLVEQYPYIERVLAPLFPLAYLYNAVPFLPFVVFLGVYSGVVNNYNFSKFVRYNAMQAVLLDILLIVPSALFGSTFRPPAEGLGLEMYKSAENTIFLFVAISVAYGMGSCLVGQTPRLPIVASAADQQVKDGPSGW